MTTANEIHGGCDRIMVAIEGKKLTKKEKEILLTMDAYVSICKYEGGEIALDITKFHPICGHALEAHFLLYPDFIEDQGFDRIITKIIAPQLDRKIKKHNRCNKARAYKAMGKVHDPLVML